MRNEAIPLCAIKRARERHIVVSTFLQFARLLHDVYLPGRPSGSAMESVMIAAVILLGHVEGRPFTVARSPAIWGLHRRRCGTAAEPAGRMTSVGSPSGASKSVTFDRSAGEPPIIPQQSRSWLNAAIPT
jgi:hypothetical protein